MGSQFLDVNVRSGAQEDDPPSSSVVQFNPSNSISHQNRRLNQSMNNQEVWNLQQDSQDGHSNHNTCHMDLQDEEREWNEDLQNQSYSTPEPGTLIIVGENNTNS